MRSVEVADHHLGLAKAETAADLEPHGLRGRRGQSDPHRNFKRIRLRSQPHVVRAEVVTPLADQVRLVDHEQPRPRVLQRLPRARVAQLLGREEHERVRVARGSERRRVRTHRLMRVEDNRR